MSSAYMGIPNLAMSAAAVTKSDTTVLPVTKAIYVGGTGDLNVIFSEDSAAVLLTGVSGFLPIMVKQVLSTSTTATGIVALY